MHRIPQEVFADRSQLCGRKENIMAISSIRARLMIKESETWTMLCPVKGIPQIGGEPEQIETTTLEDDSQTFIDGVQSQDAMSFTVNYDLATYKKIKALTVEQDLSIWLGNDGDGTEGKFTGKGKVNVYVNEADVNAVIEMTVSVTPTTKFALEEEA